MIVIEIIIYPFKKIFEYLTKPEAIESDEFFDNKIVELQNMLVQEAILPNDDLNHDSVSLELRKTSELINAEEFRRTKIFDTNEVNLFEKKIENLIEREIWNMFDNMIDPQFEKYADLIESCFCYDITNYNLNLIRILDFYQKKSDFKNPELKKYIDMYNGKDLDWLSRLLNRSSACQIFDESTNKLFMERLKPKLIIKRTL